MKLALRVLIVDDHRMFREGIRGRLEREPDILVVGEAASAEEALEQAQQTSPTIAILDVRLPDKSGIELARLLRTQWPGLKILMLSGYDFDQYVRAAARVGIEGYLLKDSPQDDLVHAIREIASGGAVLPPRIASKVMKNYAEKSPTTPVWELTVRELDVLERMHEGLRNAEIAQRLGISPRTVEAHVGGILAKLGVESRAEAIRVAIERRLIQ